VFKKQHKALCNISYQAVSPSPNPMSAADSNMKALNAYNLTASTFYRSEPYRECKDVRPNHK